MNRYSILSSNSKTNSGVILKLTSLATKLLIYPLDFFNIAKVDLSYLNSLAPGDFVVVKQKAQILGLEENKKELIKMLEQEQQNKAPVQHKIGFI